MSFAIPTLQDLVERARRAFRTHLPGTDAWLWPNNIGPTAKVVAGFTHEVMGFADYIAKSRFALTAPDIESLELHGAEVGVARKAATPSAGTVRVVATTAVTVALGAVFRRSDGVEYLATAALDAPAAGVYAIPVKAATNGKSTLALPGTALTAAAGVTGTVSEATVDPAGVTGGADLEDAEAYRQRILFRKRNPPHGGSAADYVGWALEVDGVTRVFVERRWSGPGTVRVFPLMDGLYAHGVPPLGAAERVQAHLDTLAPAGAVVSVAAAAPLPVDIDIAGLAPDTDAVRNAVVAELVDLFLHRSRVSGGDQAHAAMPYLAAPFTLSRSWLWQAVANASGEDRHAIALPAADVVAAAGQIPVVGRIRFVA